LTLVSGYFGEAIMPHEEGVNPPKMR
jgi:hypothetical protein